MPADGKIPFWIHQACEYLIALVVMFEAARLKHPAIPLAAGAATAVLAATGDGPLSAFRRVPRRFHRMMDIAVAAVAVVTAVIARDRMGSSGVGLMLIVAGVLGLLMWRTDYRPPAPRRSLRERMPAVDAEQVGRKAGRAVGVAAVAGKRWWQGRKS